MSALTRLTAAAAATLAFVVPAQAQVTFTGFTNGCFYVGAACAPGTTSGNTVSTYGNLEYRSSTFTGVTSGGGFLGIGELADNPNTGNFGSLTLSNGTFDYGPGSFLMRITFTAPSGVSPNGQLYTADVLGSVTGSNGGVQVDFNNNPMLFSYSGGSFSLTLNDAALIRSTGTGSSSSVAVTGFIQTTSVVPEPSTYLLMASGLAGLGLVGYRRRKA